MNLHGILNFEINIFKAYLNIKLFDPDVFKLEMNSNQSTDDIPIEKYIFNLKTYCYDYDLFLF